MHGDPIVICKSEGNRGVFSISANELVFQRRGMLSAFNIEDTISIIELTTTSKKNIVLQKFPQQTIFFPVLAMIFGGLFVIINIIGQKLIIIHGVNFTASDIPYCLTYALGDILTEVYGYKRVRQLIWATVLLNIVAIICFKFAIILPASPLWKDQIAFSTILDSSDHIIFASLISYWCSEFLNSYLIARLKILQKGKYLGIRVICASIISITVDNFMFIGIAYYAILPLKDMIETSSLEYWVRLKLLFMLLSCFPSIHSTDY